MNFIDLAHAVDAAATIAADYETAVNRAKSHLNDVRARHAEEIAAVSAEVAAAEKLLFDAKADVKNLLNEVRSIIDGTPSQPTPTTTPQDLKNLFLQGQKLRK